MNSLGDSATASTGGSWRPGAKVGHYTVKRMLARGGMGEIYLAEDARAEGATRHRVLKRLIGATQGIPEQAQMFLDEARLAKALSHPNIVKVYEVGEASGTYYIAMEYLHGRDVRSMQKELLVHGAKLPLEPSLHLAIEACAAMHHAHELAGADGQPLQIVHRDISPQNLFVTFDGQVKLLDFGIARSARRDRETTTRTMKGKVAYMSPEQCLSRPLDRRSDLFSLGVIIYELTLGTRLFRGNSDYELMQQIVQGTVVAPSALDPSYPASLERIVQKALQKPVGKRYQTAREMGDELAEVARELRFDASPPALARFLRDMFGSPIEAWQREDEEPIDDGSGRLIPPEIENASRRTVEMPAPRLTPQPMPRISTGPMPIVSDVAPGDRGKERSGQVVAVARDKSGPERIGPAPAERITAANPRARASEPTQPAVIAVPTRESGRGLGSIALLVVLLAGVGGGFALRHRLLGQRDAPAGQKSDGNSEARSGKRAEGLPAELAAPPVANANEHSHANANPDPSPRGPTAASAINAAVSPTPAAPANAAPVAAAPTQAAPVPSYGTVVVVATRHHALFLLDGKKVGTTSPLTLRHVDASGPHVLTVSLGHTKVVQRFAVPPGEVITLTVAFNAHGKGMVTRTASLPQPVGVAPPVAPSSAAPATPSEPPPVEFPTGSIRVETDPPSLVLLDGKAIGTSPLSARVGVGPHHLVLDNFRFREKRDLDVTVNEGKVTVVNVDFN